MGFFIQKIKFPKFHCYKKFILKTESKIKIMPGTNFL
jgi:hypothetical protein